MKKTKKKKKLKEKGGYICPKCNTFISEERVNGVGWIVCPNSKCDWMS